MIRALVALGASGEDPHEFLHRTGTSPAHASSLAGDLLSLGRRMDRLQEADEARTEELRAADAMEENRSS